MLSRRTLGSKIFQIFDIIFLTSVAVVCLLPFIHYLSLSLSSNVAASTGNVGLWPVGFTIEAYKHLAGKADYWRSLGISLERVALGTAINMTLTILTAYPLSKEKNRLRFRSGYAWFFAITMFFSGGMIPTYMIVKQTGLLDTIWALVIPGALSVWNMVLLLNFFRQVPKELEEAAIIDGAGQLRILWRVYIPVSAAAIATVFLFTVIWHWNSWFDGILYMNHPSNYPLQSYLSTVVTDINLQSLKAGSAAELAELAKLSDKSLKAAQIFLGAIPILVLYPILQRFFVKGLVVGSVKG